jgi:fructosamine-3-kinase
MAVLFGGFPVSFFDAYSAEWPLQAGAESRRPIYQLYYLLVHVNLFGSGYVAQALRLLDAVAS